jgi:beta-1,2-mannobiose phosphorylase / 1,2-beta-oligomannan phosphorylase
LASDTTPPLTPFQMQRLGMLMEPRPSIPEEVEGVLNPAAVRDRDGRLYLFPRVVGRGNYSRIGVARVEFDEAGDPIGAQRLGYALEPAAPYELRPSEGTGGCEDARVTWIEVLGLYAMAYTAWSLDGPRIAIAISEDLLHWRRLGLAEFPLDPDPVCNIDFDQLHNKDAAFFPSPIRGPDGQLWLGLIHRPVYDEYDLPRCATDPRPSIWLSYCALEAAQQDPSRLVRFDRHHLLADPEYFWENLKIGAGPPPVLTKFGWLLIYHGVSGRLTRRPGDHEAMTYHAGVLVLDERDPLRVRYRSPLPVLSPELPEEIEGIVSDVVFPTGIDDRGDGRLDVYYGMADFRIGVARLAVPAQIPGLPEALPTAR